MIVPRVLPKRNKLAYTKYKEKARAISIQKLAHFNQFYNFPYKGIAIRSQKTRWGSCSSKGNLNFNYRLVFLPPELQDYLIVHELCHVKEFNHGPSFWHEVSKTIPNYQEMRRKLKLVV